MTKIADGRPGIDHEMTEVARDMTEIGQETTGIVADIPEIVTPIGYLLSSPQLLHLTAMKQWHTH
jgi:hypothetical protein